MSRSDASKRKSAQSSAAKEDGGLLGRLLDGWTGGGKEKGSTKEKRERFLILMLAGVLLLVICIPVKKENGSGQTAEGAGLTGLLSAGVGSDGQGGAADGVQQSAEGGERSAAGGLSEAESYALFLEEELEALLSCVDGAGAVKVMVTLKSSQEEIVEKDRPTTRSSVTENDSAGGSRSSSDMGSEENTVYITDENGAQIPYVRKTVQPAVEGVVVIAAGGGSATVKKNITEAVQALFGLEAHKITVIKMKSSGK